ncbi:MAG TPA: tetratricopeptide repeat protein [Steroidobacteraceae bacterium]
MKLLLAESQLRDKHDPRGALATLARLQAPRDNRFLASRVAFLKADAYVAAGKPDSARATLEQLGAAFPELQPRIEQRLRMITDH